MKNNDIIKLISDIETTIIKIETNVDQKEVIVLSTLNSKIQKLYNHIEFGNKKITSDSKNNFKSLINLLVDKLNEIENNIIKKHKLFDVQNTMTPQSAAHAYKK